jgi:hypothetical protein
VVLQVVLSVHMGIVLDCKWAFVFLFVLQACDMCTPLHVRCIVYITPAISEGCTRLTRISHSMMYCIVPTTCVFTQFPCTPSHPPKIAGVTRCDLPGGASLKCPSTRPSHACCVRTPCNEGLYYHGGLWAAVPLIHHPPSHAPVPPQLCCRAMALEFGGRGGAVGV